MAFGCNLAFGLITAFGHNLAFGLTMAFGLIMAFGLNDFGKRILVRQIGLIGVIGFGLIVSSASAASLAYRPCVLAAATCQVDTVGCTGPNSFNGVSGIIGRINLVGQISLSGLNGISSLISHNSLINFIRHNSLVGFIGIITLAGLIGHIRLTGLIDDISFIGGFIGFVGFDLVSLSRFISDISLVSFIGLGFVCLVGFISLFGYIGLVGCIGYNSLAGVIGLSLVSLLSLPIHWPFKLGTQRVAIKLPSITGITKVIMQAAHGVATVSSATKITNAAIWYHIIALLLTRL
jgi:hypothetical protein